MLEEVANMKMVQPHDLFLFHVHTRTQWYEIPSENKFSDVFFLENKINKQNWTKVNAWGEHVRSSIKIDYYFQHCMDLHCWQIKIKLKNALKKMKLVALAQMAAIAAAPGNSFTSALLGNMPRAERILHTSYFIVHTSYCSPDLGLKVVLPNATAAVMSWLVSRWRISWTNPKITMSRSINSMWKSKIHINSIWKGASWLLYASHENRERKNTHKRFFNDRKFRALVYVVAHCGRTIITR